MKHIQVYEAYNHFNWETSGGSRLIIIEGTESFPAEVQNIIHSMEEEGNLAIVDMSSCDKAEIDAVVASSVAKILFINGDHCERPIRYAVMDLHPEIIPAGMLTVEDLG
jgi:hypothetical protein